MTLSGATTPGQSGPENNSNERALSIYQNSSNNGTSPSDCLVSYPGKKQSVYSIAPADWEINCMQMSE